MDVSVIIVNYNTKDLIKKCIESVIRETKDIEYEIIVSDNGSSDGSIEIIKQFFPQVILLENGKNLGFGKANNKGLEIAKGKYIFYLNSDTILLNNSIKYFFDYWEKNVHNKIGALGGVLLNDEFAPIHSYANFPTYKKYCKEIYNQFVFHIIKTIIHYLHLENIYYQKQKQYNCSELVKCGEIDGYITGADLFLLNNSFAKFDENYFLYCEETDLELKLAKNGFRMFIIPEPRIQHLNRKIGSKFVIANFSEVCVQTSALYYCKKNLNKRCLLLKFLIFLDRMNPNVKEMVNKIPK